jgi:PIN domain nuclease of toxin-antitoxin system
VKLLLDTHAFLWFIGGEAALSSTARRMIEDEGNQSAVNIASIWEIAIKNSLGKLPLAEPFERFIPGQLERNGFEVLELNVKQTAKLSLLPFHHRDPFDRMLVAQCLVENLPLISSDEALDAYGIERLW